MLISPSQLAFFWGIKRPKRIIHVGAHAAEELQAYVAIGWGSDSTVWIEALPEQVAVVKKKIESFPNHEVIQAVAWSSTGESVEFSVADNVESSSALSFAEHLDVHPHVSVVEKIPMRTTALSDLNIWQRGRHVFLNLDVQGAELATLRGIGDNIYKCLAIYSEVNVRELYHAVPLLDEMDSFLRSKGFLRVDHEIYKKYGWGDALYLPMDGVPSWPKMRRRSRKFFNVMISTARRLTNLARVRAHFT